MSLHTHFIVEKYKGTMPRDYSIVSISDILLNYGMTQSCEWKWAWNGHVLGDWWACSQSVYFAKAFDANAHWLFLWQFSLPMQWMGNIMWRILNTNNSSLVWGDFFQPMFWIWKFAFWEFTIVPHHKVILCKDLAVHLVWSLFMCKDVKLEPKESLIIDTYFSALFSEGPAVGRVPIL